MKKIKTSVRRIDALDQELSEIISSYFHLTKEDSDKFVAKRFHPHIARLKESIHCLIEWPYIDRVFRDSYYNYFSSKSTHSQRDCIRVSFFDQVLDDGEDSTQFRNKESIKDLKKSFRGYIVIRPTPPFIVGRNLISPHALKVNSFESCFVDSSATVNAVKMKVKGFPHSSQDTETITCAETTLWSCMEYFGSKYPEYKPVLPSQIIKALSHTAHQRQLPSNGLDSRQISSALKEFGFGSKIYDSEIYTPERFASLFSCYIESGIPIIVGLNKRIGTKISGAPMWDTNSTGHAILGIGREAITPELVDSCNDETPLSNGKVVIDLNGIKKQFVIIDDNLPPYQLAYFDKPCENYEEDEWKKNQIAYFIVPLHTRVYLEAYEARKFVLDLLDVSEAQLPDNTTVAMRFYLTSSRSYKHWVASHSDMDPSLRSIILGISMAKFLWVAELGTKETFREKKANGLVLIDATSANTHQLNPLILSIHDGLFVSYDPDTNNILRAEIPLSKFSIYENNLKQPAS